MRFGDLHKPGRVEPVARGGNAAALGVVHAELGEQRVLPHFLLAFDEFVRGVDDDVERRGAAQFQVDDLHAPIDFRRFLEVIDELFVIIVGLRIS